MCIVRPADKWRKKNPIVYERLYSMRHMPHVHPNENNEVVDSVMIIIIMKRKSPQLEAREVHRAARSFTLSLTQHFINESEPAVTNATNVPVEWMKRFEHFGPSVQRVYVGRLGGTHARNSRKLLCTDTENTKLNMRYSSEIRPRSHAVLFSRIVLVSYSLFVNC